MKRRVRIGFITAGIVLAAADAKVKTQKTARQKQPQNQELYLP